MSRIERGVYTPPLLREPGFGRIDPLGVEGYRDEPFEPRRGGMLLMVSVAVLLALIGVIWSTYNQGVREGGRDAPPRIAALAEPFKVAPADPGGAQAEHQGVRVFDLLEERLAPAQTTVAGPEPLGIEEAGLSPADVHGGEAIADWEVVEPHDIESGAEAEFADGIEPEDASPLYQGGAEQGGLTLAEALPPADGTYPPAAQGASGGPGYPIPRLKPLQRDPAEAASERRGPMTLEANSDNSDPDRRYLVSRYVQGAAPPPAGQAAAPAAATPSPATVAAVPPSALAPSAVAPSAVAGSPTPIPAGPAAASPPPARAIPAAAADVTGAFLVQVASFRSRDAAQQGWEEFHRRYDDLLAGYAPDVAQADLGDRGVHYRLRVGVFTSRSAASSFCDQVKTRGGECLVVGS